MSDTIRLGFVGDCAFDSRVEEVIKARGAMDFFAPVRPLMEECDLIVANYESTIIDGPREGLMLAQPQILDVYDHRPPHCFFLANNHVMDYGLEGIRETSLAFESRGIHHFGAGDSISQAEHTLYVVIKGKKVAFIGAGGFSHFYATRNKPGIAPLDEVRLQKRIKNAVADLIVVVLHDDTEFVLYPAPRRVDMCRRLVEDGAHLVIQHHPHVLQGMEHYKDGFIAYSMGNWVFAIGPYQDRYVGVRNTGFLDIQATFTDKKTIIKAEFHPAKIDDYHRPVPLLGNSRLEALEHLEEISGSLGDRCALRQHWFRTCKYEVRREAFSLYYQFRKEGFKSACARLKHVLCDRLFRAWLKGWISYGHW